MYKTMWLALFLLSLNLTAQEKITGTIYEASTTNDNLPLAGANVFWENTSVGTITDVDGNFEIPYKKDYQNLIVSYVGFKTDTLKIVGPTALKHWLLPEANLDEVVIQNRKQ
uniref:carboxypeptidase-like regulatory domain-containing protein n=1 Tax=uncultured Planktosalinus sp. TaxID=1810935 RepID=UPI0030DAE60D